MINNAYKIAKESAVKFRYQKVSPLEPSKRYFCMGLKRTNLAETSVSKLMSKVGIQSAAKATQPLTTLPPIGQTINHFNSKESDEVAYIPNEEHMFVENHNGVDGVSIVLKCEDNLTTHQIVFKWNHCSNYQYPDRSRREFEEDIMFACNHLCFNIFCSQHVEFTQMRSSICACFPIIFDLPKKHPYWPLPRTIPVPGLVEGLVYHSSCLSLCSCQFITKLTTSPNSRRCPCNRIGSVHSSDAQINCPFHIKKQNKIDQEHIKHQNTVDGNLDSFGIETLDNLMNVNPNSTGLRNQEIYYYCPLSDIKPGKFIMYHLSGTAQELRYSPNHNSFPFDVQPFSLKTNSTGWANDLGDRILLNKYDQCFFDDTNFGNYMDGGGIILHDQKCLPFSLNNLNSLSNLGKGCPCPDKPGTNTLSDWLYCFGNLSVSSHLQTLDEIGMGARSTDVDEIHMGVRSTDIGLGDLLVGLHLQMLDEICMGARSTDVGLGNLWVGSNSQLLKDIHMGARSTDVGSGNLSANADDIHIAAKSLVGIIPHKDCTPSIDQGRPNLSQPVGTNLTQTSLLVPHGSNLSQSTAEALLQLMGGNSDDSKPHANTPSLPSAPNLVPHPESPLDNQPTKVPISRTFQSPASTPNLVAPNPAIRQSDSTSMIHSIAYLVGRCYCTEKTEMKQVLENIVIGDWPVSNQEAPGLSKVVWSLFNNQNGAMTLTTMNVIVDLFNHQTSNNTWGKFKISQNPSDVREAILGSKLKNPSDYIDLYCKAANLDFNNPNSGYFAIGILPNHPQLIKKNAEKNQPGERAHMDIKHQIEEDNTYAELYSKKEESSTPKNIDSDEDASHWESPPGSPLPGIDLPPPKYTRTQIPTPTPSRMHPSRWAIPLKALVPA
eukprot:jgi/Psemu1/16252/gm1.16252_g